MSMIEIETENENENEEGVEAERQIVIGQGSVSENATGIVIGKENGTEINEKMSGLHFRSFQFPLPFKNPL